MDKIILITSMFFISTAINAFSGDLDTDPSLSKYDLSLFAQAAECLSIKASFEEKNNFILSALFDEKVNKALIGNKFDKKLIDKDIQLYENDFDNIIKSMRKHCPNTFSQIKYRLDNLNYKNSTFLDSLQDYIVTVIYSEIVNTEDRARRFESNHSGIGLDLSPY